jgi:AraC-like DNA-binding protein
LKAVEISLSKSLDQSFIFYHEKNPFSRWHYHVEYELVLIIKGAGKRMVGDSIERFEEGDLVLLGSNVPHEWLCDISYFQHNEFSGEAIVIQFKEDYLGGDFFKSPENKGLLKILNKSTRGCIFSNKSKEDISKLMLEMLYQNNSSQFYTLFKIFNILASTNQYQLLSSPNFPTSFLTQDSASLKKSIEYIMQNFQQKIQMKDLLKIANMSSTTFSLAFKQNYNLTFTEYLTKVRIGFACSLLSDTQLSISQISLQAGFENLSNFNRLFKKAKGFTPKEYRLKVVESEKFHKTYTK